MALPTPWPPSSSFCKFPNNCKMAKETVELQQTQTNPTSLHHLLDTNYKYHTRLSLTFFSLASFSCCFCCSRCSFSSFSFCCFSFSDRCNLSCCVLRLSSRKHLNLSNNWRAFKVACSLVTPFKILKEKKSHNRPFATNDHVVQNPPCWKASSLLFLHWDIKTKASQASLVQVSLF